MGDEPRQQIPFAILDATVTTHAPRFYGPSGIYGPRRVIVPILVPVGTEPITAVVTPALFSARASRRDLAVKEIADKRDHFVCFVFERKMPGVDQVKLDLGQVALVGVSAVGREDLVVLAPDDQRRRLVLPEIGLHLRIKRQIAAIVVE